MLLTQSNERIITELEIRAKVHRQEKKKARGSVVKEENRENGSCTSSVIHLCPEHNGLTFSDWRYKQQNSVCLKF